jgi:SAM-dependent methyltransferase
MDPLEGSPWSSPETVAGFSRSGPNETLLAYATRHRAAGLSRALDIGCGAGRNTIPLAQAGFDVLGTDLSFPMLAAAAGRAREAKLPGRIQLALAPMELLPVADGSVDLVIAHGIWNLARSGAQFRAAVREGARAARPGARLFLFTFSRTTLPAPALPLAGERFVFTQFSGEPQCFLTAEQLIEELSTAGFTADDDVPLTELNRPAPGRVRTGGPPVIYEGTFVRV